MMFLEENLSREVFFIIPIYAKYTSVEGKKSWESLELKDNIIMLLGV